MDRGIGGLVTGIDKDGIVAEEGVLNLGHMQLLREVLLVEGLEEDKRESAWQLLLLSWQLLLLSSWLLLGEVCGMGCKAAVKQVFMEAGTRGVVEAVLGKELLFSMVLSREKLDKVEECLQEDMQNVTGMVFEETDLTVFLDL